MKTLRNISLSDMRKVLKALGLEMDHVNGGHECWKKDGQSRPVIIQTHIDPIPVFIINSCIKTLGISKKDFLSIVESI